MPEYLSLWVTCPAFRVLVVAPEHSKTDTDTVDQVSGKILVEDHDSYSMGLGIMIDIL